MRGLKGVLSRRRSAFFRADPRQINERLFAADPRGIRGLKAIFPIGRSAFIRVDPWQVDVCPLPRIDAEYAD
jgi:hypothetical protein